MKKLLLPIILLLGMNIIAQDLNFMSKDPNSGKPMLLGYCNREAFSDSSFSWWYNSEYNMYELDTTALKEDADKLIGVDIEIVMGTWCSDSRREVPRFYNILDYLHYPTDKIKLLMVGRDKKGISNETDGLNIEKVPTIIFYKDSEELGRIIEVPVVSLEKDMNKILNGKP